MVTLEEVVKYIVSCTSQDILSNLALLTDGRENTLIAMEGMSIGKLKVFSGETEIKLDSQLAAFFDKNENIQAIKYIRELHKIGLKEAKEAADVLKVHYKRWKKGEVDKISVVEAHEILGADSELWDV